MKKNLLSFFMLMLSIGLFPGKMFAQVVTGGSADGSVPIDGGINVPAASYTTALPPSFVLTLKRNNGNGVCAGSAQARLSFKGFFNGWMQLVDIATLSNTQVLPGVVIGDGMGVWQGVGNPYMSFCLNYNIPPKNKLIFHFYWAVPGGLTYQFWIPET